MSYQSIIVGYQSVLRGVPSMLDVLDYVPTSVSPQSGRPIGYLYLKDFDRGSETGPQRSQIVKVSYLNSLTLCFLWQSNEQAEREIAPFLNSVPAAIDADPWLANGLRSDGAGYQGGLAWCSHGRTGFTTIGGVEYRAVEFDLRAYEKFQYRLAGY